MLSCPLDHVGHSHVQEGIQVVDPIPLFRVELCAGEVLAEGLQELQEPCDEDDDERPAANAITHVLLLGLVFQVGIELTEHPESWTSEVVP